VELRAPAEAVKVAVTVIESPGESPEVPPIANQSLKPPESITSDVAYIPPAIFQFHELGETGTPVDVSINETGWLMIRFVFGLLVKEAVTDPGSTLTKPLFVSVLIVPTVSVTVRETLYVPGTV
jgi:hypothetical protein